MTAVTGRAVPAPAVTTGGPPDAGTTPAVTGDALFDVALMADAARPVPAPATGARCWLGVVCRDHVRRGTALGIAQLGHGKRTGLARLSPGDWLVYYSPRTSLRDGDPLSAFTAIGQVADDVIWQADEGAFQPWRRRVDYLSDVTETRVRDLAGLDLTADQNWGYALRRGLLELTASDFLAIRAAMVGRA
ncbi:EVE domain-containing protein [Longispora sp. K20-0274]|uniref:EVE domain-containing protein n=1 Tax=Longispora sp. K20-0274 TaxID=3088255 RepID=UPI00399A29CC